MTWLRIDDSMPDHPKILGLSDGAFRLHLSGLCYAARYLTDGYVNASYPKAIHKERFVPVLIAAGLWSKAKGGWQINDYLEYNPSREKVERDRAFRHDRAVLGGKAKAKSAKGLLEADIKQDSSRPQAGAKQKHAAAPVPGPSPTPLDISRDRSSKPDGTVSIDQPQEPRPELPKALERILDARILDDLTHDQCALVARAWFHGVELRHSLASVESAENPAAMLVAICRRITKGASAA